MLDGGWIETAFERVDRESFVPARAWVLDTEDPDRLWPVDRARDGEAWRRAVWNPRKAVVTQLEDGRVPPGQGHVGLVSSSVSAPSIALRMLRELRLSPEHHVLEIGYASGYHTALLCERVGQRQVTAVEIDPELAAWGRDNLLRAGYAPCLVTGDGMAGCRSGAPYDRVISTASVRRVPPAWLAQASDGAWIVTPFGTAFSNLGLLGLRVDGGRARGRFLGRASYIWVRDHRPARRPGGLGPGDVNDRSASPVDPDTVVEGSCFQDFVIGLRVPDIRWARETDDKEEKFLLLWDEAGTSTARVRRLDWWRSDAVVSCGPRRLWQEAVGAYTWYEANGRPCMTRCGVSVTPHGQWFWLDNPERVIGPPMNT
ncbi:protein-L-isoaspartate O-methyltransferase family protein [Streptomyces chartreusis]|uniref:protein-L-isoaspartate O-methyltransferase family protein n=1 Tax=Streptomyces chartreusis TaxID=1969 RepID=UPI002E16D28F